MIDWGFRRHARLRESGRRQMFVDFVTAGRKIYAICGRNSALNG